MRILLSGIWLRVALVAASLVLFLIAAKNHGRHIRLERQLAGHWEVSFARANPPWVEALWQRDRVIYWSIAIALALFGLVYAVLARRGHGPIPPRGAPGWSWWSALLVVVVWPLVIAFMTCAAASLARFLAALPGAGVGAGTRAAKRRRAATGSPRPCGAARAGGRSPSRWPRWSPGWPCTARRPHSRGRAPRVIPPLP